MRALAAATGVVEVEIQEIDVPGGLTPLVTYVTTISRAKGSVMNHVRSFSTLEANRLGGNRAP